MVLGPLQFSSTIRARHLRCTAWSGRIFCDLRRGDWNFGARDELRHAGYRWAKSAAATTLFATFFYSRCARRFGTSAA